MPSESALNFVSRPPRRPFSCPNKWDFSRLAKHIAGGHHMLDHESAETGNHQPSDFQDREIACVDCGDQFTWTIGEQVFFHDKGLRNEPKRCKPCKQAKNDRLAAISAAQVSGIKQRIEVTVKCAQCGEQTTVPFFPSQGRPVYCRSCFLASRTMTASA